MVLPPVETTPVLLMRFTPKASRDVITIVTEALTKGGIIIVDSEGLFDDDGKKIVDDGSSAARNGTAVVLGLTTTQSLLEHEAEIIRLVKPCKTSHKHVPIIMERFSSEAKHDFINIPHENEDDYDVDGLFTSAERALLVQSMIDAIETPKSLEVDDKLNSSGVGGRIKKAKHKNSNSSLIQVLHRNEHVDVICPVHIPHIKKRILTDTYKMTTTPPLQSIRNYYGEEVAFYFAWMHFMTYWFVIPGVLGLLVFILRTYRGDTVDTCDITPFFGLATFCWAVLCNRFWDRREAELAYKWGTFALTDGDRLALGKRTGFRGEMRRSPITGRLERYYPVRRRRLKILVSAIVTLFLLLGACIVMVISMNLQGYVSRADRELWGDRDHPLYYPFFSQLAEEGGIFDSQSVLKSFLPIILRAIAVLLMNEQYSSLAEMLTKWENHETLSGHQNSVILKRVLFEAFDAYVVLFYLAIYERDIALVRLELVGAFHVDTLRRVLTECLLPYIIQYFREDSAKSKKDDDLDVKITGYLSSEADRAEYDTFDDYIEMLIQFGYVTLFASAYPLAAFLAIVANFIEMRTDVWKLTHLFQRRSPVLRANSIGMWRLCLKVIAWLAAGSNLLIFAFTSSQMRQWFPDYYVTDEVTGRPMPKASSAGDILLIVLIIEHCLILIAVLVRNISNTPHAVREEIDKQIWVHDSEVSEARHRKIMKLQ